MNNDTSTDQNNHSGDSPTANHLPEYIDLESAVNIYKERIRNLEKFRDLFFEAKETLIDKEREERSRMDAASGNQQLPAHQKLKDAKDKTQNNISKIQQLEYAIRSLEVSDEAQKSVIEKQLDELTSLSRSLNETSGCITILESELTELGHANGKLKEELNVYQEETKATFPNTDPSSPNANLESSDPHIQSQQFLNRIKDLEKELADTTNMAFTAMRSNADIGSVIHFLVESFKTESIETLADLVFSTLDHYYVEGIMEITYQGKKELFSKDDAENSELKVSLSTSSSKGKLIDLDHHLVINSSHVRMAIKDFNREDIVTFNNLKDHMQILILGINSNIERILAEINSNKERANLERLIKTTHKTLDNIDKKQKNEFLKVHELAISAMSDFRTSVNKFQIPDDQKNNLLNQLHNNIRDIEELIKGAKLIDQGFVQIINTLSDSINKKANRH